MGMGISEFLAHESGGNRESEFLRWKDFDKKSGEVVLWWHTAAPWHPVWSHHFYLEDEVEDKEAFPPKKKMILRTLNLVCQDDVKVYDDQFFRDKSTDHLKTPPLRDPFLILREYLRASMRGSKLRDDQVVFEWQNHKQRGTLIQWCAGTLSGLVKTGQSNWDHNLNARLHYLLVVVPNTELDGGAKIAKESKLLGDAMKKAIKQRQDSVGVEKGDPMLHPYAFKWVYNGKESSPMNQYSVYPYEQAQYTDEVHAAITSEDYPDVSRYAEPGADDLVKTRAAFEAAQQVELPLDMIFSGDAQAVAAVMRGDAGASQKRQGGTTRVPPAKLGGDVPAGAKGPAKPTESMGPAKPTSPSGKTQQPSKPVPSANKPSGRKKKEEPPPPAEDLEPCPDCDTPFPKTATECPNCHAKFEVDDDEPEQSAAGEQGSNSCVCGETEVVERDGGRFCAKCGMDRGDDLPFA